MPYDLFVSYAHDDNTSGHITELMEKIAEDYFKLSDERLTYFFDKDNIKGMDDWPNRILTGLRDSTILLQILTPTYILRPNCISESIEYLKYERSRALEGQGIAPVYYVEIPNLYSPDFQDGAEPWLKSVCRRQHFDLRPWYDKGSASLQSPDVYEELGTLVAELRSRILKLRGHAASPGNLPAGNPHFVGRQTEMQAIHKAAGLSHFGIITAVQGMGGLGKTALATQYACSYAQHYPGGRWSVECVGQNNLASVIRQLDADLGVSFDDVELRDDTRAAKRILAELESRASEGAKARAGETNPPAPRALLLLDNVDSADMLQPPQTDLVTGKPFLHILATTRLSPDDLGHGPKRQSIITVDELPEEDALRLIEDYQPHGLFTSDQERTSAADIVRLLGCFTLAVEVVAVYLGECGGRVTCNGLLERLCSEGLDGLENVAMTTKRSISHVQKLMSITLIPTLELLTDQERLVLSYAALLPPDSIPLPWLRTLATKEYPELGKDAEPGYDDPWLGMVNHLLGLRLLHVIEVDPDARTPLLMRMHRLMGELVRGNDHDAEYHKNCLVILARERCAYLIDGWLEWGNRWEIAPLGALASMMMDNNDKINGPYFANIVATHWHYLGYYTLALPLFKRAIAILEKAIGPEQSGVAAIMNNLATLYSDQAQYAHAETLYTRALAIDKEELGEDHPDVALDMNNLAGVYHKRAQYAKAKRLYIRALAIRKKALGADHPDVANSMNNLAALYCAQAQYAKAEPLYKRSLEIREKALGADHPDVANSLNNLAMLYRDQGKYALAEPHLTRALAIREKVFDRYHPNLATSLNNLALIYENQADYAQAEPFYARALDILLKISITNGHEYPNLQACKRNHARCLGKTGKNPEEICGIQQELFERYGMGLD